MSIRLRLTLIYTLILALTLALLGGLLYATQWRAMRQQEGQMLLGVGRRLVSVLESGGQPPPGFGLPLHDGPGDARRERRFGVPATYWQVSDMDGKILAQSPNLDEVEIPLPDRALGALLRGSSWSGTVRLDADRLYVVASPAKLRGGVPAAAVVARSVAAQDDYLDTMRRNLLIGGGAAVALAFVFGWVLAGLALRPVHQISRTAKAIGSERDFSRRVDYSGPNDEIGELAATFNTMLGELEVAYRQQQQFVADVSHELRTPLTTLRGNLGLLRRNPPLSSDDREEVLADMASESDRLIRLVNDLLRLARADAGQSLQGQIVPVRPLVEDVARQASLLDPQRTVTFDGVADIAVLADRDGLKQVLLILVDNALKHTTGPLAVEVAAAGDEVSIGVRDAGPGIPPEDLPHVFDRFYRGHNRAEDTSGLGLGLPIAKALVEAQGGSISVESGQGEGSVFTVTLPMASGRFEP